MNVKEYLSSVSAQWCGARFLGQQLPFEMIPVCLSQSHISLRTSLMNEEVQGEVIEAYGNRHCQGDLAHDTWTVTKREQWGHTSLHAGADMAAAGKPCVTTLGEHDYDPKMAATFNGPEGPAPKILRRLDDLGGFAARRWTRGRSMFK